MTTGGLAGRRWAQQTAKNTPRIQEDSMTTPDQPLSDDDMTTSGSGSTPPVGDADGTDSVGADTDGTDGDATDTTDGDAS